MLLWGGANPDGTPYLNPAFAVDAPPALPTSDGEYEIVGRAADGGILCSLSFDMPRVADSEGRLALEYAIPVHGETAFSKRSLFPVRPAPSRWIETRTNRPSSCATGSPDRYAACFGTCRSPYERWPMP